jgi:hypothetical protein
MSIELRDFQLVNTWKPEATGPAWDYGTGRSEPMFLVDQATNRRYLNENPWIVRVKCGLLGLATPIAHPIASVANIVYRIARLFSFVHFREPRIGEQKYNFMARLQSAGRDLARVVATPFSLIGLQFAALYGLFRPYDGRKLYATLERATYGHFIIAPCFQPGPKYHAFGGDINKPNSF